MRAPDVDGHVVPVIPVVIGQGPIHHCLPGDVVPHAAVHGEVGTNVVHARQELEGVPVPLLWKLLSWPYCLLRVLVFHLPVDVHGSFPILSKPLQYYLFQNVCMLLTSA